MRPPRRFVPMSVPMSAALLLALAACHSGRGAEPAPADASRLLVTADTTVLARSTTPPSDAVRGQLAAVLAAPRIEASYRLTTPAGEPFAFDLVTWRDGSAGAAKVAVLHLLDGAQPTSGASTTLAAAGIVPNGRALVAGDRWIAANGDGLARLTLQGRIERDQVLAVTSDTDAITVIELDIGDRSAINRPERDPGAPANVLAQQTIYSSDSMSFGVPTVAVSGDRTSVVCYEGDRQSPFGPQRYEMRLQHDGTTGAVTGGGSVETSADTGYWRDHEIAALYNVLAVARAEADGMRVRLSFDRGATFAQDAALPLGAVQGRLVQLAIAADYTLAVACWRASAAGSGLDFVLVEGRPIAVDANGSPTWFQFDPPQVVHTMPIESSPLTTGIAWSGGGDLVIGYGASWFTGGGTWTSTTEFRCAVRRHGEGLRDRLVDSEQIIGMDPTVAVLGTGAAMRVFYAYETRGGLRLAHSEDGGDTFVRGAEFGHPGDHQPAVFARDQGGATRLDVFYLAARQYGIELHQSLWLDGPASPREDIALTTARLEPVAPGAAAPIWNPGGGATMRSTQVSWLGFDAVPDGDDLVVVYDEVTVDGLFLCWGAGLMGPGVFTTGTALPPTLGGFQPAAPPPLAPGMTEPVPAIDAAHAHQLVLLRID